MTMLSFRVDQRDAERVQSWAERLGVDRSALLRDALRLHLVRLSGENDADAWVLMPATDDERAVDAIADWGPAEDWSDWADAAR
jgi:antitoxin MazE2